MILKYVYIYIYYHVLYVLCVFLNVFFSSNLYLYNTVLSVLFCVNKDIIIGIGIYINISSRISSVNNVNKNQVVLNWTL